jgi:hypothetical protein
MILAAAVVNNAPILATIGALSSVEDNNKVVTFSATDDGGDTASFSASSDSGSVTASVSGAILTFTPALNYFGTANITVTTNDGSGAENATDPAFTNSASDSTQYGSNLDVILTATDVETSNDNITFALQSSDSSQITASLAGATLTLTPVNNCTGNTTVILRATDTDGGTTDQDYVLTILAAANEAPVSRGIHPLKSVLMMAT